LKGEHNLINLKGICPILSTPFTQSGNVDLDSMRNLVWTLTKGGCHGVTLFGIGGEHYKLNDDESKKLLKVVVEESKKSGVSSIVSVTQHATELAVRQAKYYEEAGADCLMLLPPFFLKPGAEDLYHHIKLVGKAVKIPIMVQYAPENTGVSIAPGVFTRLSGEVENIIYYKVECKPVGAYLTKLLESTQNRIGIFVGNAGLQLPEAFERGAVGAVPGCSLYDIYLKIYNAFIAGNREEVFALHNALLPILNHIRQSVEMIIAFDKRILQRRGIIATDYCRMPTFTSDSYYDRLFEEYYEQLGHAFNCFS
jgi:dihydrodipicolinate synthase/N-acetylneuraminate lyase